MTEEQLKEKRERLDQAIQRFQHMEGYDDIIEWLKRGAWMNYATSFDAVTSPEFVAQFPAALHNPGAFAQYFDGRRSMVAMLEEGQ